MILYKKVREIPGAKGLDVATEDEWLNFFESMNLQFDFMLEEGWIIEVDMDLLKRIEILEHRINYLEQSTVKHTSGYITTTGSTGVTLNNIPEGAIITSTCPCRTENGGSGVCHCILGSMTIVR